MDNACCGDSSISLQGEALDVILVRPNAELQDALPSCSDFSVHFPHMKQARIVQVRVNGRLVRELTMQYNSEKKHCRFERGKAIKPEKTALITLLQEHVPDETNDASPHAEKDNITLQYDLLDGREKLLATASSNLFVWDHHDSVVVCDIDGTITKSNARGALATMILDNYDYVHDGVCAFLQKLSTKCRVRILYLTSRPIGYAQTTRKFLSNLLQDDSRTQLPRGPLFLHSGNLGKVLFSELITKDMHEFKSDTLFRQVVLPFVAAGRSHSSDDSHSEQKTSSTTIRRLDDILVAGFGNSITDVVAYEMVGIARENIYMIDKKSCISCIDERSIQPSGETKALASKEQRALIETVQADLHEARIQQAYAESVPSGSEASLNGNVKNTTDKNRNANILKRRRRSSIKKIMGPRFSGYQDPELWKNIVSKLEAATKPQKARSNTCMF